MKINLLPIRSDKTLTLALQGDVLAFNGEDFDFSPLPEAATLPHGSVKTDWMWGPVDRIEGELVLTVRNPYGPYAPQSSRQPQTLDVAEDGAIPLPDYGEPPAEPEPQTDLDQEPAETEGEDAQEETSDGQY